MNGFLEAATGDRFEAEDTGFRIVVSKFQAGFNQPKRVALFVDKKLRDEQSPRAALLFDGNRPRYWLTHAKERRAFDEGAVGLGGWWLVVLA
jgi:hypothetical protein